MKFVYDDSNKEDIKISLEENEKVIGEIKFKKENESLRSILSSYFQK